MRRRWSEKRKKKDRLISTSAIARRFVVLFLVVDGVNHGESTGERE